MHDRVPSGPPEPGVGCPVLRADVGLEFNDPTHAPWAVRLAGLPAVADEARPQECRGRLERRPLDERGGRVQREKA